MQLFSEDYLMHYGVKGMKWKKRKGPVPETDTGTGERVADIQGAYDAHRRKMAENKNFERYDSYRYGAHNFQDKRSIRDRGGNYSIKDKQMRQMRIDYRKKKYERDNAKPKLTNDHTTAVRKTKVKNLSSSQKQRIRQKLAKLTGRR